jgi:hypothetical protein
MNAALLVALTLLFAIERGGFAPKVSVQVPEAVKLVQGKLVEARVSVAVVEGYHCRLIPPAKAGSAGNEEAAGSVFRVGSRCRAQGAGTLPRVLFSTTCLQGGLS